MRQPLQIFGRVEPTLVREADGGTDFPPRQLKALEPLAIDKLHAWTLHLETADGKPVENATITVHGDMPGHGHGLPTKPIVSTHRGNGDYLVEGMKFQMTGWWFVEFDVIADGKQDTVRFDFVLK